MGTDTRLIRLFATASIIGTNYCLDALQLIILIVRRFLTIICLHKEAAAVSRHHQPASSWIPPANCEHTCAFKFSSFTHSDMLAQL